MLKNEKGFTLIELLAVIIILGVLMLIAIPSVTSYINNSRKAAYVDTAKRIVDGAVILVNSGGLDVYDTNTTYYIPGQCINTETGGETSPYGEWKDRYVVVTYTGDGYDYYWASADVTKMGINLTYRDNLKINDVKAGIGSVETTSNAAQATLPLFNASARSCSTTICPRLLFMMMTPSFILEIFSLFMIPVLNGNSGI